MSLMMRPNIRCAVCNTLVEEWETYENTDDFSITIKVRCHGASDEMRLSRVEMMNSPDLVDYISNGGEGVAFAGHHGAGQAPNLTGAGGIARIPADL